MQTLLEHLTRLEMRPAPRRHGDDLPRLRVACVGSECCLPSAQGAEATYLDPVAGDLWSVKNILIPAFIEEGHSPPWPYPSADPDLPSSSFRNYLDNSMNYLLAAGYDVTNDPDQIDVFDLGPPGEASAPTGAAAPFRIAKDAGGYELTWSAPFRGGPVEDY